MLQKVKNICFKTIKLALQLFDSLTAVKNIFKVSLPSDSLECLDHLWLIVLSFHYFYHCELNIFE